MPVEESAPGGAAGADRPHVTAAVLAGGVGARMGGGLPKQLLPLAGRAVLEHAVAAFCAAPEVDDVIVLMVGEHLAEAERIVAGADLAKVSAVLPGGATRTATSAAALAAVSHRRDSDLLLLHDAARPLVTRAVISGCVAALATAGAVGVAVPSGDTVVEVAAGPGGTEMLRAVPPRASLRRMQTPQGFRLGVLRRAYESALADPALVATDDCGVVLRYLPGEPVRVVEGDEANIKITHPGDVEVAEVLLRLRAEAAAEALR
ncbi:2-C-methyl-D-erythritol 4-phosphate cytidylyltransferase [Streptomonospora nanhaiensis]|uniref:2-C-methyl-D-erythritol 4-phosphate cytidylyltransferase n=1 Tax=Streptomonospora nanhaiensis TaxID=1323731 RepID=A0A853BSM6_9ACTN|nr:IspD/TarI family cytidylyltransferase [Streptomonospora nanhaiensis]MBV2367087.1 2-C-methyl-D-erythritol 4-phosphate cytidylyltransferase [Streptomonospora nanhaiensis]MBX9391284.1 2-C-methyl-D-erythritol 4-phosphate cytidylyltransferase [Streptomonospora nanhaiensis]NYI97726.1 2-C-methyl-D-erythritol 4-phosphate cytidylyltransferase [Streptomonospora nanhaiensis]